MSWFVATVSVRLKRVRYYVTKACIVDYLWGEQTNSRSVFVIYLDLHEGEIFARKRNNSDVVFIRRNMPEQHRLLKTDSINSLTRTQQHDFILHTKSDLERFDPQRLEQQAHGSGWNQVSHICFVLFLCFSSVFWDFCTKYVSFSSFVVMKNCSAFWVLFPFLFLFFLSENLTAADYWDTWHKVRQGEVKTAI